MTSKYVGVRNILDFSFEVRDAQLIKSADTLESE
jgi:hypothetical protein